MKEKEKELLECLNKISENSEDANNEKFLLFKANIENNKIQVDE